MKPIIVSETYPYKLDLAWEIISDLKRSDWVPGVENITLDGDVRSFTMEGMGEIKEKILLCDEQKKILQYSAIQTSIPIKHHLATIELAEIKEGFLLKWTVEIQPSSYIPAIEQSVLVSLKELHKVLKAI